jgi:hypothetical protein
VEELVAIGLQIFFEFGVQLLGAPGIDGWFGPYASNKTERGCGWIFLHFSLGGLCGWISTLIVPKLVLAHAGWRVANLIFAPLIAGVVSYLVAKLLRHRTETWTPFWHGFTFALAFGLARFAFGTR